MRRPGRGWRLAAGFTALAAAGAAAILALSAPVRLDPGRLPAHVPDVASGERIFLVASCGACHAAPEGAQTRLPIGGRPFRTPVGTFYPGNLTPDPATGLGRFTTEEFVDAVVQGVSPAGTHYFPAFPYPSYRAMRLEDVLDLWGYLRSLPPVVAPGRDAEVPLARAARRGVGLWKRLALSRPVAGTGDGTDPSTRRGAYLVNGPGHCGECHTPRTRLMVPDATRLLAGGPHPGGEGVVPGLRGLVERKRYTDAADLATALREGETLGYDRLSAGGMGAIQANLARLPEEDLRAIAAYLVSLR